MDTSSASPSSSSAPQGRLVRPPAALRFADLERLGLVSVAEMTDCLVAEAAAFCIWNVPSLGANPGLRMLGCLQACWQRDGSEWHLQAQQRLLLEECDRYDGEYRETFHARCSADVWRSLQSWRRTTEFLTNDGSDLLATRTHDGRVMDDPAAQHDPVSGQRTSLATVSAAGLFAVLSAVCSHNSGDCTVVNMDGLAHRQQLIVDTASPDQMQSGEVLQRVVRHGDTEHPWTYWLRADGVCLAACCISTVLIAHPSAATLVNQRREQSVYGVHVIPSEHA